MKNVEVYLSEKEWVKKPTSEETKNYIAKPILNNRVSLTLKELAKELSENSKVSMLGLFPKGTKSASGKQLEGQELLMLDIDNTNKKQEHFTYEDALNTPFVKENVAFMYKTLSSTDKHERFRMVVVLDTRLESKEEVSEVYTSLFKLLRIEFKGQLDESIKNANRLFFGGTQGYDVINWDNTFKPEGLLLDESFFSPVDSENEKMDNKKSLIPDRIGSKDNMLGKHGINKIVNNMQRNVSDKHSIPNSVINVYELLEQKRFSEVKEKLATKNLKYKAGKFKSLIEFRNALNRSRKFSMQEFLDLPNTKYFLDIFHDEENNSSNIYVTDKGVELYKCFSRSAYFVGDIVSVINKLTNEGEVKTMNRLAEWLEVAIDEPLEITETKEAVEFVKSELLSNELKIKYPYIYKMLWRYTANFCTLLDIYMSKGYAYNDTSGKYEFISYMSRDTINAEYATYYGKKMASGTLHTTINLMAMSFLIKKLSFKDIPRYLKIKLLGHKKGNGYSYYTDVVVIPKFDTSFMFELNDFCKILSDTSFTKAALSKDYVLATYGQERAVNTFSQVKPEDSEVSENFQEILRATIKIIDREFKVRNFIKESTVIERLYRNFKRSSSTKFSSKTDVELKYKQIRSILEDGYGYSRLKLTNSLREELSITIKDIPKSKRPHIFIRPEII